MHGFWVVTKTSNTFSAIPIDQAHEHNNKIVNGSGEAVGLTENPTAFRKWMVAGPEQARIIQEFEDTYMTADTNDEGQSAQKSFRDQVSSLVDVIREMGNPFKDDFAELVTLIYNLTGVFLGFVFRCELEVLHVENVKCVRFIHRKLLCISVRVRRCAGAARISVSKG